MAKSVELLNIDVDKLFKQHNVAEIDLIHKRLQGEIELKREELRTMVGERYRDLLKAADTIGEMKQTAGTIIKNIDRITARCQQLNEHNLIGFRRSDNDYQRLQKKHHSDHSFHGVIVQIKLLTSLPEMIWSSIDREDYFVATQLFIFARHVSTGLNLDTERETARKFPVAAKQWQVLSQFFYTIQQACLESLGREELSVSVASKSLASWLLLEACPVERVLAVFTERRSKAFLALLEEHGPEVERYGKVKDKLLASLRVLIGTVRLFYKCFLDDEIAEGTVCGGFQRELLQITDDQAVPTIELIRSEDPMILQMVPEVISKFRPRLQPSFSSELAESEIRSSASGFIKSIEDAISDRLRRLVSLVPSIKTLHDIKTQAYAIEKPSNWTTITGRLGLEEGIDFYVTFYQRLINDRVQYIIKSSWSETVRQTAADLLQLLQQPPSTELKAFVWRESLEDVPLNLRAALERSNPGARKLLMKARAYPPAFVTLLNAFNERVLVLVRDVASFLATSTRTEVDDVLAFFRECCVEGVAELVTTIKSASGYEPTVERYALLARFLIAIAELCPALRECFLPNTTVSSSTGSVWCPSTRKSSLSPAAAAITVSEEDPERWAKVSGLLEEESLRFWSVWVERFHESWPPLPVEVGYGTLLNDFPSWETVTIEENDENNQPIQSTIRVPSLPSIPLQRFLHHVCDLLNEAIPQTIPRAIVTQIVELLATDLRRYYEQLAADEFTAQNQSIALQYYLDLRFLQLMFVGREQKQLSEQFTQLTARFKSYVDPFDFDVFYAHLNTNVKRSVGKLQHFLGVLVCQPEQLSTLLGGTATGQGGKVPFDKNANILALSSNSMNVAWFPLLPIVTKDLAVSSGVSLGSDSAILVDTKVDQRKKWPSSKTESADGTNQRSNTANVSAGKQSSKEASATGAASATPAAAAAAAGPSTSSAATAQNYAKGAAAFFGLDKDWFR
ncbi:conserved oligomeric Golgi complex subunit 1-like isoform X1 [Anopheles albimanus]|uniref:Conserved oligomeric Golgi complex subunit 1 n=1 Tax=Anopheles albimanus TaxID=7167 RepID=A0A8W7K7G6_ANOAL|nr:conserved oligomeric Golgi complex subunit 1-like isoform X1 [Anopheles albimanus]